LRTNYYVNKQDAGMGLSLGEKLMIGLAILATISLFIFLLYRESYTIAGTLMSILGVMSVMFLLTPGSWDADPLITVDPLSTVDEPTSATVELFGKPGQEEEVSTTGEEEVSTTGEEEVSTTGEEEVSTTEDEEEEEEEAPSMTQEWLKRNRRAEEGEEEG
jgi:hypothetical protein